MRHQVTTNKKSSIMSDVCVIINEGTPETRRRSSPDGVDSARHPSTMANEEDSDADDEEDDDQDDSDFEGHYPSRISLTTTSQPLDLDGSIVVGGTARRRGSICSSCGTYTSRSCDGQHDDDSCASSRSTRGYSPTRDSSVIEDDPDADLPYPGFRRVTLFWLTQTTHPRDWCLKLVTNPYPFVVLFM